VKQSIKMLRKPYWFEKFYFFITSDNYIVVAGRDAQQNEVFLLVDLNEMLLECSQLLIAFVSPLSSKH